MAETPDRFLEWLNQMIDFFETADANTADWDDEWDTRADDKGDGR